MARADGVDDVGPRLRDHDADRLDLIDAGVGGIECAGDAVEPHLALDGGFQLRAQRVGIDGLGTCAHRDGRGGSAFQHRVAHYMHVMRPEGRVADLDAT